MALVERDWHTHGPDIYVARIAFNVYQATLGVLMEEAKQSFCVLAGGKEFLRDSMVAAMLSKNQIFPTVNLLVVPLVTEVETAKGFGPKSMSYEGEGYIAAPVDVRTTMQCILG